MFLSVLIKSYRTARGETSWSTFQALPSYMPYYNTGYTHEMTFFERTHNLMWMLFQTANMEMEMRLVNRLAQNVFGDIPYIGNMIGNMSGLLVNTNFVQA